MDTHIVLGGFVFRDLEIPAQINFGGDQKLVVHELVGGQRTIDAMGQSDVNITWSGLFTGSDAINRAMQIDAMRIAGQPILLTWFNMIYYVLVENFTANTERFYQVNYSLSLKVLNNFNYPAELLSLFGFSDAIINDFKIADAITSLVNIPSLTSAMSVLNTSISSISSFKNAPVATISSVISPLNSAKNVVGSQLAIVQNKLFGN